MALLHLGVLLLFSCFVHCGGWKAVPLSQAQYAVRSHFQGAKKVEIPDDELPRGYLHSTYKFGYCPPEVTIRQFLRSKINMSFETLDDKKADYIYVLADFTTTRFKLQCVVMKGYVARKFIFKNSRLPIYYCQGSVYIMVFNSVQRLAIHEFYLGQMEGLNRNSWKYTYMPIRCGDYGEPLLMWEAVFSSGQFS